MKPPASTTLLAITLLTALTVKPARAAGELKVIANPEFHASEISIEDLRSVYLGQRSSLKDSGPVQPVLGKDAQVLQLFASEYLGKSATALATYYRSLVFTGKWSMPVSFSSDAEVVAYVARTRGAIGFVRDSTVTDHLKTLRVK
jgi:hypothetical protein